MKRSAHCIDTFVRMAVLALTGIGIALAWHAPGMAAAWPDHPVKLIVAFPPGGGTDIVSRIVAQRLTVMWGQAVVVENRPGASGNLAFGVLAKSPADGYTLGVTTPEQVIAPSLYSGLSFNILKSFTPITMMARLPLILVAGNSFGPNTIGETIALAKANPGKVNFASTGLGGPAHLAVELLMRKAGVKMTHIPYKGSAPAYTDLMSGQVQFLSNNIVSTMPLVQAGKLKPLAVTSAERSPIAPDVPTVAESGLPGFDVNVWYGLLAPAGTPAPVIDKIARDVQAVLKEPDVRKQLLAQGAQPVGDMPAHFGQTMRQEVAMWADVIHASNISIAAAPQ
jgi:tripartite-type tricarboxylate transporter receptor subunit TctC